MAQESWKKDIEQTECETPEFPILCANKCGFFGNAMTNNLCSKCYTAFAMKHKSTVSPTVDKTIAVPSSLQIKHVEGSSKLDGPSEVKVIDDQLESVSKKQPATRCAQCQKRVGLTGFKCRCGDTFCSSHRYCETHKCSFDYKTAGRERLAKENLVVKAEKLEKL